ncbi:hypothetical protein MMC07_005584 [Pseudocyphellaria aurata]|nr:hypothetical protein [Pseudocyphellaria aurata]
MDLSAINHFPPAFRDRLLLYLSSQDLKRMRLVCKEMDCFARKYIFRLVWLRADCDSYRKLDLISRHPVLREYVTAIHHSGEMVYEYSDFDRWSERLGGEKYYSGESRDSLREQFTFEDLQYHYLEYQHHIEGQRSMENRVVAKTRLIEAFGRFPGIDTVEYASKEIAANEWTSEPILSLESLSAIGQKTLSEPCYLGGRKHHTNQFITLLQVALQCCRHLATIKGIRLPWEIFERSDQVRTIRGAVKKVHHLILGIPNFPHHDTRGRRRLLARVIANAVELRTLELYFGYLPMRPFGYVIELGQLLKIRKRWSTLQRLVLQGFCTKESYLKKILAYHADSLMSLGLSNMEFELLTNGRLRSSGSIFSLIKFLQSSMRLEQVQFSGTFCNQFDESWIVNFGDKYADDHECLKSRVENFIVHGGQFPLREPKGDPGWKSQGDDSWRFNNDHISLLEEFLPTNTRLVSR